MKKYIKSIVLSGILLSTASCIDQLTETPDSYYDKESFFTSVTNAEMAVLGVYDPLAKLEHYGQFEMAMPTSDDMYYINGTNNDGSRRDISHYMLMPSNQWIDRLWMHKYKGIDLANITLSGIRGMDLYKEGNEVLNRIEGDVLFLRALYAFDLVKYWGDVPFKTDYTQSSADGQQPRKDREEIYNQIIEDLNVAISKLNWASAKPNPEKASQGAARALKMRVLMQRAGYSLKMDGQLSQPADDVRQNYFAEVVKEFEAIQAEGYHKFGPEGYVELWKNLSSETKFTPEENLFEIAFFNQTGENEDAGNWGTYIGPIVNASSSYGRANAFFRVLPEWLKFYDDADVRRDVNICQYEILADNSQKKDSKGGKWTPGKWRREWMAAPKNPNNTDVNFIFIRYADVVLLAAEAYNELGQTDKAIELINSVRGRANATLLNADLSNYASIFKAPKVLDLPFIDDSSVQGKIRTALYWERGFELCYEGMRKYDLIRWGVLGDAIKLFGENTKLNTATSTPFFAVKNFTKGKHELFPIPLDEMQMNNMINVQNPGF